MDKRQLSHDIMNMIERLRIMHELVRDGNFSTISKDEIQSDLEATLVKLREDFELLLQ